MGKAAEYKQKVLQQIEKGTHKPAKAKPPASKKPKKNSPALANQKKHKKVIADSSDTSTEALELDVQTMKGEKGKEAQREYKEKVLIPKYEAVAEKHVESESPEPNLIFVHLIIWLFDVGRISKAVEWGLLAIKQSQAMPSNFSRDIHDFVFYQYFEWLTNAVKEKQDIEPSFTQMITAILYGEATIPPELAAKYLTVAATLAFEEKRTQDARLFLDGALEFNPKAKVVTLNNKIDKELEATTGAGSSADT